MATRMQFHIWITNEPANNKATYGMPTLPPLSNSVFKIAVIRYMLIVWL